MLRVAVWPIEVASKAAMYLGSGGALQISFCACAWLMQWRGWIWLIDRAALFYENNHTRASFERYFG